MNRKRNHKKIRLILHKRSHLFVRKGENKHRTELITLINYRHLKFVKEYAYFLQTFQPQFLCGKIHRLKSLNT